MKILIEAKCDENMGSKNASMHHSMIDDEY